jgi:hypothetical protein
MGCGVDASRAGLKAPQRGVPLRAAPHSPDRRGELAPVWREPCRSNGMTSAGWYRDPTDGSVLRYWDGASWTQHLHPAAQGSPAAAGGPIPRIMPAVDPDLATVHVEVLSDIVTRRLAAFAPLTTDAAWCEDPLNRLQGRWWDGAGWTGHIAARPTESLPVDPAQPVATGELGREGVNWPSPRETRYLDRCAPVSPGWYLDPVAPALRGRWWDGKWSEQVRARRDVVLGALPTAPAPGDGDPEDIARTRRSLAAWSIVGASFLVVGVVTLLDPKSGHALGPALLGIGGLARAYAMHAKLRSLPAD